MNKKEQFIITVEGLIPATFMFSVLAEDENQAYEFYEKRPYMIQPLGPPKFNHSKLKKNKVSIRKSISNLITWVKNF